MPVYGYEGIDKSGRKRRHMVGATSAEHAIKALHSNGMTGIKIALGRYPDRFTDLSHSASEHAGRVSRAMQSSRGKADMTNIFYTLSEASLALGISEQAVRDMAGRNELQQFRNGDRLMFKRDQVDAKAACPAGLDPCLESGVYEPFIAAPKQSDALPQSRKVPASRGRQRAAEKTQSRGSRKWLVACVLLLTSMTSCYVFRYEIKEWLGNNNQPAEIDMVSNYEGMASDADRQFAEVQTRLQAITPVLQRLVEDRESLKQQLIRLEVSSSADLKGNTRAQIIGRELAEVVMYAERLEQKQASYEDALFELEAIKRRIERQAYALEAGLNENELGEIDVALRTIRARLEDTGNVDEELGLLDVEQLVDSHVQQ